MNVKESLDALRPLARQAKAAANLEALLDSLVSVETHGDELQARLAKLKADVSAAEGRVAEAEAAAVKVCADAKAKADLVAAVAKEDAEQIVAAAQSAARAEADAADGRCAQAQTREADYAQAAETLKGEIAALTAKRDALAAEVASLRERASAILA